MQEERTKVKLQIIFTGFWPVAGKKKPKYVIEYNAWPDFPEDRGYVYGDNDMCAWRKFASQLETLRVFAI